MRVSKAVGHPQYDENTDQFDIGLLFLENSTPLNISFPRLNQNNSLPALGSVTHVMGWGDMVEGDEQEVSDELMAADLEVISNKRCKKADGVVDGRDISYENWIFNDMLCTFSEGKDACQGDSGKFKVTSIALSSA